MQIGRIFGIKFLVNPYFILLVCGAAAFGQLGSLLLLFMLVLWHELAHTLVAYCYGFKVSEIELLPFGGVARLNDLLELDPWIEAIVALVGPLSNILLVIVGWGINQFYQLPLNFYLLFIQANLGLVISNLLPALPLDGGRILRSRLVVRYGFRKATQIAALIAQIVAFLLGIWGVVGYLYYGYPNQLVFIGLGFFIFMAAAKEKQMATFVFLRYLTRKRQKIKLKRVMKTKELVASIESSIGEVVDHFVPSYFHLVRVLNLEGELIGILTELELINGLLENGFHGKISRLIKFRC